MAFIGPYFNTKSFLGKEEEIFFDESRKIRMGLKFNLELHLISTDENEDNYIIPFIQFIIGVQYFECFPIINTIEYTIKE